MPLLRELGPRLVQCGLGRGLLPYPAASSSIQPYAVARPLCLSSVCLSVTLVRPTQAVEIFGNISTAFGTMATR